MVSDASISKRKNEIDTHQRGALYSGFLALLGLQWISLFILAILTWGFAAVDFGGYLLLGESDPLIIIVKVVVVAGLLVPVVFTMWMLVSVIDAWRMRISGYRNLLTIAVGQVFFAAIIAESIPLTIAALVSLAILLALAHFTFYPEYRGMPFLDLFRDLRFIKVFWQAFFVAIILIIVKFLVINVYQSLVDIRAIPTFDYLFRRAGFAINQSPEWYSSNSRYGDAFMVGVINTLQVVWVGLVAATVIGVLLGIFLLSQNWLVRTISRVYVEILRNTPLLVQLIFWYFVFWLGLPNSNLSFPNESIMVVPLRYFPYLFALIGAVIYVWRFVAPSRLLNGFLTGFVIAELAFWLLGASYFIIIILGLVGAAAFVLANREDIVPHSFEGLAKGIGIMLIVQVAGHLMLDVLGAVGALENTRVVYGEVVPMLVLGPNLFATPNFGLSPNFLMFAGITVVGIVIAIGLYIYWGGIIERTGADIPRTVYATAIIILVGVIGWFIASRPIPDDYMITVGEGEDLQTVPISQVREEALLEVDELAVYESEQPIIVQPPQLNRFGTRVEVGNNISVNYMALLIGLVIYTSAFIGEIVRAGIQAVPWGQVEASRALGFSTPQTLRMIVLPQALRVIIPPLGNQYLNLSKNSSLATAIAFSDTYQVGQTIMNQSGQSITGFFLILVVYLSLSLIISLVMNLVNSRFQLVTR